MVQPLSPGVFVTEIDLSNYIPSVSTSVGAFAGYFQWGPIFEVVDITDHRRLRRRLGDPTDDNFTDWFTAANFLDYASSLKVVRAVASTALNSTADGTGLLIPNEHFYRENYNTGQGAVGMWAAKYPSVLGDSLSVSLCSRGPSFNSIMTSTVTSNTGNAVLSFSANVKADATRPLAVGDYVRIGANTDWLDIISITNNGLTVTANVGNAVVTAVANTVVAKWRYADLFDSPPFTSDYVAARGGANDDVHIVVVDRYGKFSNRANTILEKFAYLSLASDAKASDGSTRYYRDVLDTNSRYIYWMDHIPTGINWGTTANAKNFTVISSPSYVNLGGGVAAAPSDGDLELAYDQFADKERLDISLLLTGGHSKTVRKYVLENISMVRIDCVTFMGPDRAVVVNNDGDEVADLGADRQFYPSTSYGFYVDNWKYQFDKINDVMRWNPMDGDTAGLAARTDSERDAWWSFAGYNRGQIKNVTRLAWKSQQADRDELYKQGINSIVNFLGEGTILYGDRTMLLRPSAFDRINVRRLFIVLEKAISLASKYTLFEFNDAFTRSQFVNMVEPYLRDVQGRRGIYDFRVICDESNNDAEVIDNNQFVGDIYIKPAKSINYVILNFVATRTGVVFEEIAGRF